MGNSTILSVALFMGTIAIIVCVLSAKTPVARLPEGTLLLNVVGMRLVAFEAIREFGLASSTLLAQNSVTLKTVFTFLDVRWSLSSENAGDVDGISGGRANAVKVGNKSGANGSVSKVAFHYIEFALGVALPFVELDLLALYRLKLALTCLIPINISNNPRILEIYDGVVDEKAGGGGWMEDIEVIIFDPRMIEIGSGMCSRMKGNGILRIAMLASPYKVSVNANLSEGNITCHLVLTMLIEEDKGVLPCITAVVLTPSVSWMIWIIELLSELGNIGDRARCRR